MSTPPRVSVVIPVYNRRHMIKPSLDSALSQSYSDFEIIVVDDGSTDDVLALLRDEYPTVRAIRMERNAGAAGARNRGVSECRGELVAFLDSDDIWSPDKLDLQVRDFDEHGEAVLSFSDVTFGRTGTQWVYSDTQPFEPERTFEQLLDGGPILPSAVLVRKRDFIALGGFVSEIVPAEDRDLWLRFAALGPFRFLPLPLIRRVVYDDALSHRSELWEASFDLVVTRFLERPEGQPYRERRNELRASQLAKIGIRHLTSGTFALAVRFLSRACLLDPLALVRRNARRLLRRAVTTYWQRFAKLTRLRRIGRRTRRRLGAENSSKTDPRAREYDSAFRPPPPAPPAL